MTIKMIQMSKRLKAPFLIVIESPDQLLVPGCQVPTNREMSIAIYRTPVRTSRTAKPLAAEVIGTISP